MVVNANNTMVARIKVAASGFLFFFVSLPCCSMVWCETGWYVVPVQITKTDSTIQLEFFPLLVEEREEIPITEVRKIKAIGEVGFVPGNGGD